MVAVVVETLKELPTATHYIGTGWFSPNFPPSYAPPPSGVRERHCPPATAALPHRRPPAASGAPLWGHNPATREPLPTRAQAASLPSPVASLLPPPALCRKAATPPGASLRRRGRERHCPPVPLPSRHRQRSACGVATPLRARHRRPTTPPDSHGRPANPPREPLRLVSSASGLLRRALGRMSAARSPVREEES